MAYFAGESTMSDEDFRETPEDAFLAKYEKERDALQVLFPDEKTFPHRIKIITTLKGKHPDMYKLYSAFCQWEILDAMELDRDINWEKLDPVVFLTSYAPSLKGRHADRAVEIARAAPMTTERGFVDRLLGRE